MEKLIFLVFVLIAEGNTFSNKVIYEDRESLRRWRGVKNMHMQRKEKNYQCPGSRQKFYNDKLWDIFGVVSKFDRKTLQFI